MSTFRRALLRACLLAAVPIATFAQTEPVIFEAEGPNATLGTTMVIGTDGPVTFVETGQEENNPPSAPGTGTYLQKVGIYTVTFPAPGNYELYARYLVGPNNANDDSWYFGRGFNNNTGWARINTPTVGFNQPTQTVYAGGTVSTPVFRWTKVLEEGQAATLVWTVPAGQLTQTFYWATRENGMRMDKFAFGRQGSFYRVSDLDSGGPATGVAPPTPPPTPPPYTRTGLPLATAYAPKYLGSAHSGGTASLNFGAYWNQVTPENGGKWDSVEGTRDTYQFGGAIAAQSQAIAVGGVFKWHTLFWGNQQPLWMYDLPPAEQLEEIHEWLAQIAANFPNLEQIEVVNEPTHDPPDKTSAGNTTAGGRSGGYIDALGGAANDQWIITAFELARQYFPNAKLMLNDYSITNSDAATTRYLEIINRLQTRGLIDLIGIQGHAFEFGSTTWATTHRANMARLAATGLPVYVTELDIDGVDPIFLVQDDALQLQRYQQIFPVFWEDPAIQGITMWGYVQGAHWRNSQGAWLLYTNGAERPALQWLVRYMENKIPVVTPGQTLAVDENVAAGTVIGSPAATDGDADALSQWQLTDASGKFTIDASSGAISLAAGASLDFEMATSYPVGVSVYDGYRRSATESVTIEVTNLNDNVPVITAGQSYRIDGGKNNTVARVLATDADDTNQPGFTTFSAWAITSGNTNNVFRFNGTGDLQVGRPLLVDWRKSSYSLGSRVSDGANNSAVQTVQVTIPNRVNLCLLNAIRLEAPKAAAPLLILLGAELGSCR